MNTVAFICLMIVLFGLLFKSFTLEAMCKLNEEEIEKILVNLSFLKDDSHIMQKQLEKLHKDIEKLQNDINSMEKRNEN